MKSLTKQEWVAVAVAIVATVILFFGGWIWDFITGSTGTTGAQTQTVASQQTGSATTTNSVTTMQNISTVKGLEVYDEQVGTGAEVKNGQTATVHYVGFLTNGTKFDSSVDRKQPFPFVVGAGQVIKGWDLGLVGMKVGGVRRLVISPDLAYGNQAIGPIPANSTLVFEVQLLDVK